MKPNHTRTGKCKGNDHEDQTCYVSEQCCGKGNRKGQCGYCGKDILVPQAKPVNKIVVSGCLVLFLLAGSLCVSGHDCHASTFGPDKDMITGWLYNKKAVVGKQLGIFNRNEIINIYNVKAVKIIDYKDDFSTIPFSKNTGAVWVEFTYTSGGQEREYLAMFTYTWELGLTGKTRYLKDVSIKNK